MSNRNLIVPVNAQGRPVADTRPQEAPPKAKLSFVPAADGTVVKIADRPRPANHPGHLPWTQKFLATHSNQPFAIVMDDHVAELVSTALNVYFSAVMQRQAEDDARAKAAASAATDANLFDAPLPAVAEVTEVEEVDAVTGAPESAVGEPSEIEQLPSL